MLENLAREKLSYRKVDSLDKSGRSSKEKGLSAKSAPCFNITKIAARLGTSGKTSQCRKSLLMLVN